MAYTDEKPHLAKPTGNMSKQGLGIEKKLKIY